MSPPRPRVTPAGRWADLAQRVGSALVILVLGGGLLVAPPRWSGLGLAVLFGALLWELARLVAPVDPVPGGQLPVPHPRPRPEGGSHAAGNDDGRPGLRRRVPQAHLAPELRQLSEVEVAPAPATPAAASALSRYQASRQAALVESDGRGERA